MTGRPPLTVVGSNIPAGSSFVSCPAHNGVEGLCSLCLLATLEEAVAPSVPLPDRVDRGLGFRTERLWKAVQYYTREQSAVGAGW